MIISSSINTYNGDKFEGALISPLVNPNRKPDITNGVTYVSEFENSCTYKGLDSIRVRDRILSEYTFDMKKWKERKNNSSDYEYDEDVNEDEEYLDVEDIDSKDITTINPIDVINAIRFNINNYYSKDKELKTFNSSRIQYRMEDGEDGELVSELELEEEDCSVGSNEDYEVKLNDLRFALYQLNTFTEASTIEMTSWALLLYMIITERRGKHNSDSLYTSVYFSERNTNRRLPRRDSRNSKRPEFIELRDAYWNAFTKNMTSDTLDINFARTKDSDDIFISKIIYKLFQDLDVTITDDDLELASYENIANIPVDFDLLENDKSIFKGVMEVIHNDIYTKSTDSSHNSFSRIKDIILTNMNMSSFDYNAELEKESTAFGITNSQLEKIISYINVIENDKDLYEYHSGNITEKEYRLRLMDRNFDAEHRELDADALGKVAISYINSLNRLKMIKNETGLYNKYGAIRGGKEAYESGDYSVTYAMTSHGFLLGHEGEIYCSRYGSGENASLIIFNCKGYAIKLVYNSPSWFYICTIDNFIKMQDDELKGGNYYQAIRESGWTVPLNI